MNTTIYYITHIKIKKINLEGKNVDESIVELSKKNKNNIIAIGEIGLDKNYENHNLEKQIKVFKKVLFDENLWPGEDPKFIARRMVILASEDIGLAHPTALVVANAAFRAVEITGLPECAINLAHAVAYLCECKKDRSAYEAYGRAMSDVKESGNLPVPLKLRNAPTKLMQELDYGKGYESYTEESLLPEQLQKKKYLRKSIQFKDITLTHYYVALLHGALISIMTLI